MGLDSDSIAKVRAVRRTTHAFVLSLIASLVVQTWLAYVAVVPSGSMAPALRGVHQATECPECGSEVVIGAEPAADVGRPVQCGNCGAGFSLPEHARVVDGERVLVLPCAYQLRPPRRWEVVAFRQPRHAAKLAVKRVVGRPSEVLELREGDVWIDDHRVIKSPRQQAAMSVLVHDANHTSARQPGWYDPNEDSLKCYPNDGGLWTSSPHLPSSTRELVYLHCRQLAGAEGTSAQVPITPELAYNQTRPLIDTSRVNDLRLVGEIRQYPKARFHIRQSLGPLEERQVYDAPATRGDWTPICLSSIDRGWRYTASTPDQEFIGFTISADNVSGDQQLDEATDFSRGKNEGRVDVRNLRVERDVYYTVPADLAPLERQAEAVGLHAQVQLTSDEYYVLGDNSTHSFDSRYRRFGRVTASMLAGRPIAVVWSPRSATLAGWHFQVPTFSRIRYIRSYDD